MKKLILVAVAALLLGVQANAQIVAKAAFIGGLDKVRTNAGSDYMGLNGFAFGADYKIDLPWVNGLGVEPGIFFNFLFGLKNGENHTDVALSIPLHATYTFDISNSVSLIGITGPTVQIGLAKTSRYKVGDQIIREKFYAPDAPVTFRRFMVLWDISAGVELFDMIQISTGVDLGLSPFVRLQDYRYSRPVQYKFTLGYMF